MDKNSPGSKKMTSVEINKLGPNSNYYKLTSQLSLCSKHTKIH